MYTSYKPLLFTTIIIMSHFSRVLYTMIASLLLVIPFVTHGQQEAPADSDAQVLCTVTTLVYDEYINAQLDYQEALSAANYSLAATSLTLVNDIRSLYCPDAGPFVTLQPDNFPAECMGYMQMLLSNYKRQLNGGSIGSANQLRSDIEALLLMPDCTELITTVAPSQDPNTLQALLSTEHQAASSQERALVDIQNNMCFLPFAQTYPQQIASIIDDNMLDNVSTMIDGLAQTNNSLPTRLAQMRQGQILQYAKSVVDYEKLKR